MITLQRPSGWAAILLSLIYISAFVYYGALWAFPSDGDAATKMMYLTDHQLVTSFFMFTTYILFGLVLSVLVAGLNHVLKVKESALCSLATAYGYIWVVLVIASGMVALSGIGLTIDTAASDPEKALEIWTVLMTIAQSIGGDNEIVGAVWVTLVSFLALREKIMSAKLHILGLFVGLVGILTVFPFSLFTELFGVFQIIWFVWLGVCLLKLSPEHFSK